MDEIFQSRNDSLYLPDVNLFLDSKQKQSFGYISHAHSDHIARHTKILCTPETSRILSLRLKKPDYVRIPFFRKTKINGQSITLLPAGHILGSAQIYYETEEGSLLYTGDFRTKPSRTAESLTYQSCDVLVMETTFGSPRFRFPPRKEVEEELLFLIRKKLSKGMTPVIFVYPLGKGQEALHLLCHANIPVAVESSILNFATVYEQLGIKFGKFEKFKPGDCRDKVVLLPIMARKNKYLEQIVDKYTIFLSGWGKDLNSAVKFGVDTVLPYSDHADFDELLTFVDKVHPSRVYCTHGINDFAAILREKGYWSKPLTESDQHNLFY
jgi:Cft2 family RNA processing exonuclease